MSGKIIDIPLDATARNEVCSLVYRAWSVAFDNLKFAKNLQFDRKVHCDRESYEGFKTDGIKHAQAEFDKLNTILESIKMYSPLIRGD